MLGNIFETIIWLIHTIIIIYKLIINLYTLREINKFSVLHR